MPLFSVIIPCHNAEATLVKTLSSAACQTFSDFEVIMIDDGSTDKTAEIAKGFANYYDNFRYIRIANGGPSNARNAGALYYAKGDILAFLDADDLWSKNKLARMAEVFSADDAPDAVFGKVGFIPQSIDFDELDPIVTTSSLPSGDITIRSFLQGNPTCTMSNIVVRTDAFKKSGGFTPSLRYAEDVEWIVRLLHSGARMDALDEVLVYYRTSDYGLSSNLSAMHEGWRQTLQTMQFFDPTLARKEIAFSEASHLRYLARRALRLEAPRGTSARLVARGIITNAAGFFADRRQAWLTMAAALVEPLMPRALRDAVFAD
ncbi:MAG: glycosyltransferase [Ahrensia sp.]